jgi:hypothetical protein
MNITDAWVYDPRSRGMLVDPVLELKVNEPVFEIADPIYDPMTGAGCDPRYRWIPCGPFYAVEFCIGKNEEGYIWDDIDAGNSGDLGEFNTMGFLKDQLVPVRVTSPEDVLDLTMIVPRARRLIRKYDLGDKWNLIVDEQAALIGSLKWRVELRRPVCYGGATPGEARCPLGAPHTIIYRETHLTLCETHLRQHQGRLAARRQHRTAPR